MSKIALKRALAWMKEFSEHSPDGYLQLLPMKESDTEGEEWSVQLERYDGRDGQVWYGLTPCATIIAARKALGVRRTPAPAPVEATGDRWECSTCGQTHPRGVSHLEAIYPKPAPVEGEALDAAGKAAREAWLKTGSVLSWETWRAVAKSVLETDRGDPCGKCCRERDAARADASQAREELDGWKKAQGAIHEQNANLIRDLAVARADLKRAEEPLAKTEEQIRNAAACVGTYKRWGT
jgi:hypothetical protein